MGVRPVLGCLFIGLFCVSAEGQRVATFTYRGGGQGTVTFDHEQHASRGYVCADCHTRLPATGNQLFETHKQGLISVADHSSDGKCFACHNGEVAFATCEQCHR
ncbi:MAG: c(7)-type cytochrome triheme domain-containing protein [Steroidobacteraceae bacterium]|jgi:c(7)-type cytochrome triheme protein